MLCNIELLYKNNLCVIFYNTQHFISYVQSLQTDGPKLIVTNKYECCTQDKSVYKQEICTRIQFKGIIHANHYPGLMTNSEEKVRAVQLIMNHKLWLYSIL